MVRRAATTTSTGGVRIRAVGVAGIAATVVAVGLGSAPHSHAHTGPAIARVVTLGDSYSAGTGIHRDGSDYDDQGPPDHSFSSGSRLGDSACMRELDTTPAARLADRLDADALVVACAGATIADVANQLHLADGASWGRSDGAGTVLTLTVGGNDVRSEDGGRWTDVLADCVLSPRCHRSDDNQLANVDVVGERLVDLYTEIADELPDATLLVLGYPRPMQPDRWGCVGVTGVGRSEARWIDEQVDAVNAEIERSVRSVASETGADLRFVSVEDEFDNHGSCRIWQRDRYVNDAVWGETVSRELDDDGNVVEDHDDGVFTLSASSFHPSQKGYDAFGRVLAAAVGIELDT